MASSLYILDSKAAQLIHRAYRGDVTQNVPQVFARRVLDEEEALVKPVFEQDGVTYCFMRVNDLYFVATSRINCNPLLLFALMQRMVSVFRGYFNEVNDESVRDNYVMVYELLDEMVDFGYPQYTEESVLKQYIMQEGFRFFAGEEQQLEAKALPSAVTGVAGAVPWRAPGKKYRKNEVFVDVVEKVNVLLAPDGESLSSEVLGTIKMKTQLSGMPELKIGLNDKLMMEGTMKRPTQAKSVELEDVKFHDCVKLNRFDAERCITFIPPDGEFDLMTYRLNTKLRPLVVVSTIVSRHGSTRVEVNLVAKTTYKKCEATFIDIIIPVPSDADRPQAKASGGTTKYVPEESALVWSLKKVAGGKEFSCRCEYTLPTVRSVDPQAVNKRPLKVAFEIPYFAASGFQVRYLKVTESKLNYEAQPWVRYMTMSGEYHIRTH